MFMSRLYFVVLSPLNESLFMNFNSLIWCRRRYTVTNGNNYSKNIFCWYWAGWCQRRNGSVNKKRETCIVVVVAALHNLGYYSTTIISFKSGPNLKSIAPQSWNRSGGYREVCGSRTDRCLCFVSRIIVEIKRRKTTTSRCNHPIPFAHLESSRIQFIKFFLLCVAIPYL